MLSATAMGSSLEPFFVAGRSVFLRLWIRAGAFRTSARWLHLQAGKLVDAQTQIGEDRIEVVADDRAGAVALRFVAEQITP